MNEDAAASLALDAYQALQGIGEDVAQVKGQNSDVLAAIESLRQTNAEGFRQIIARDSDLAIATDAPEDSNWVTEVRSSVEVPPTSSPTSWASSTCRRFFPCSCWSPSCSTWALPSGSPFPTNGGRSYVVRRLGLVRALFRLAP